MIPDGLRYTADHEWVRETSSGVLRVGITDFAQEKLDDVVFVQMPEPGTDLTAGEAIGEVESTKSVSEVNAPVSGVVTARNATLDDTPELVNTDPYGEGWLFELEPSDASDLDNLLSAEEYGESIGES